MTRAQGRRGAFHIGGKSKCQALFQPTQDLKRLFVRAAFCLKIVPTSAWHLIGSFAPELKYGQGGEGRVKSNEKDTERQSFGQMKKTPGCPLLSSSLE
jgi:hypothetical protein